MLAAATPSRSDTPAKRQYWVDSRNGPPASNSTAAPQGIAQSGVNGSPFGSANQCASGTAAAASRPSSPALSTIRLIERRVAIAAGIAERTRKASGKFGRAGRGAVQEGK